MKKNDIKILLVDDEPDIIEIIRFNLEQQGYKIFTATDGIKAIKVAKKIMPHLIIMDLSLTTIDCLTATAKIKEIEAVKGIPVIALSAHAMPEHRDRALKAGCSDYDTKPVDIKRLLEKIGKFIEIPG